MMMIGDGHGLLYCRELFGDADAAADHPRCDDLFPCACADDDDDCYFSPRHGVELTTMMTAFACSKIY